MIPAPESLNTRTTGKKLVGSMLSLAVSVLLPIPTFANDAVQRSEPEAVDLSLILDAKGALWRMRSDSFVERYQALGFDWTHKSSRSAARAWGRPFVFGGLKVWDHSVRFHQGRVKDVNFSLYNRGDAGEMSKRDFDRLLESICNSLDTWAGGQHVRILDRSRKRSKSRKRWAWVTRKHRLDLVCSYTPNRGSSDFRPEFVRLRVVPFDPNNDPRKRPVAVKKQHGTITVFDLRKRVARLGDGDVYIPTIPMVDQGEKGYCAVATMERLMQYYGRDFDQHELAQDADTSSSLGTDPETMIRVLRSSSKRVGLRMRVHLEFGQNDFKKLLKDYNRLAKKAKKRRITVGAQRFYWSDVIREMDADLLVESRMRRKSAYESFKSTITKQVQGGVPLAWSVIVGKFAEQPSMKGGFGGHLRMIIGYNRKTDEVLYSDTWGPGHELKRLRFDHAWAMTIGYFTVLPANIRL